MENNTIRSFFAIPVPAPCRQKINEVISGLKKDLSTVFRWVNTENLHLTLKFLGEFKSTDIQLIKNKLEPSFSTLNQFELIYQNLGVFPNERKPRVIWIGLNYPDELRRIFQEIENAALELGYLKEERGFSPHITIGRVKNDANDLSKISSVIKNLNVGEICTSQVNRLIFFQSTLMPAGPVYSELFHLLLKQ
jgi:RNA 2',3'-cyclic 3'-phosphodiesterase